MASSSSAAGGSAPAAPTDWLARIHTVQASRITPDMRRGLLERAEHSRQMRSLQMETRTVQARSGVVHRSLRAAVSAPQSAPQQWLAVADEAVAGMSAAALEFAAPDHGAAAGEAAVELVPAAAVAAENSAALMSELDQLKVEPADSSELAAKFKIFETYLATVASLRGDVYALWERVRPQFAASTQALLARRVRDLDRAEALGVGDTPGVWLVHGMMRQAAANHASMSAVIREVETKLALMAAAGDCPMCMEPLALPEALVAVAREVVGGGAEAGGPAAAAAAPAGKPAKLLACCHKTCAECCEQWSALQAEAHKAPFCPICRNVEFLQEIAMRSAARVT